jgi:hypothetical protein
MIVPQSESSGFFIRIPPCAVGTAKKRYCAAAKLARYGAVDGIVASAGKASHPQPSARFGARFGRKRGVLLNIM